LERPYKLLNLKGFALDDSDLKSIETIAKTLAAAGHLDVYGFAEILHDLNVYGKTNDLEWGEGIVLPVEDSTADDEWEAF